MQMIKEFKSHVTKHSLHYADRMNTVATEIVEVYYVNLKGHLNTFWVMVLYVKLLYVNPYRTNVENSVSS